MSNFREIDRDIAYLLPPSVDEWLPEGHLARFVVEVVEGLDLSAMVKSYRGSGSASYHPTLLLGLLVYGYATGVFSSPARRRLRPTRSRRKYIPRLASSGHRATPAVQISDTGITRWMMIGNMLSNCAPHDIWRSRGCLNGAHLENFAQAERELKPPGGGSSQLQLVGKQPPAHKGTTAPVS